MRRSRMAVIILAAVLGCEPEDGQLFFEEVPYPTALPTSVRNVQLEFVREFGDREEGLVFGRIGDIAISEGGILAVVDQRNCGVWIVDSKTGNGSLVGKCGGGPGEFRMPNAVAFSDDTLLVWDQGHGSIIKLTLEGEEIDRFPINLFGLGAASASDLRIAHGGDIVMALHLLPPFDTSEHEQIIVLDSSGRAVTRRGVLSPHLAMVTPRNILRPISYCMAQTEEAGEIIVALNPWGPQLAMFRLNDFEPLLSFRVPVPWARAGEHSLRPGEWGPHSPLSQVECGDRYAVASYRRQRRLPEGGTEVLSAALVVVDLWEPSLTVVGGDAPPDPGSLLLMTPAAAIGDRFFFFSNSLLGYPKIREYRVIASGGDL